MKMTKITSIMNLSEHLQKAVTDQRFRYQWLVSQCKTQGLLAQTKRPEHDIIPMSLNTFKEYADAYIEGGFRSLDQLRVAILEQVDKPKNSRKKDDKEMAEKVVALTNQLERVQQQKAVLQKAYFELNKIMLQVITDAPHHRRSLERHSELYDNYFSLRLVVEKDEQKTL